MDNLRLIDIETKISFQENTINTLNDVIYAQQQQIDKLELICQHLASQFNKLESEIEKPTSAIDEIPPHY